MNKYKVEFERVETGYIEVFADNEDDAVQRLYNETHYGETIKTLDCEYRNPKII